MTIKDELNNLKECDVYSLLLFALYKIRDIKEYSTISELVYLLDKESFLNLCEYFGGLTIKIPTIAELESLINSLMMYQYIDIDGYDYEEAIKLIGFKSSDLRKVKKDYNKISRVLEKYTFTPR